jgi:hypothetical protein
MERKVPVASRVGTRQVRRRGMGCLSSGEENFEAGCREKPQFFLREVGDGYCGLQCSFTQGR